MCVIVLFRLSFCTHSSVVVPFLFCSCIFSLAAEVVRDAGCSHPSLPPSPPMHDVQREGDEEAGREGAYLTRPIRDGRLLLSIIAFKGRNVHRRAIFSASRTRALKLAYRCFFMLSFFLYYFHFLYFLQHIIFTTRLGTRFMFLF